MLAGKWKQREYRQLFLFYQALDILDVFYDTADAELNSTDFVKKRLDFYMKNKLDGKSLPRGIEFD